MSDAHRHVVSLEPGRFGMQRTATHITPEPSPDTPETPSGAESPDAEAIPIPVPVPDPTQEPQGEQEPPGDLPADEVVVDDRVGRITLRLHRGAVFSLPPHTATLALLFLVSVGASLLALELFGPPDLEAPWRPRARPAVHLSARSSHGSAGADPDLSAMPSPSVPHSASAPSSPPSSLGTPDTAAPAETGLGPGEVPGGESQVDTDMLTFERAEDLRPQRANGARRPAGVAKPPSQSTQSDRDRAARILARDPDATLSLWDD